MGEKAEMKAGQISFLRLFENGRTVGKSFDDSLETFVICLTVDGNFYYLICEPP